MIHPSGKLDVWTHHGYAVNVKDDGLYEDIRADLDVIGERESERLYEIAQEGFWDDANELAREHGYREVFSEGRMGGWLVVQPQPKTDDMWESQVQEWEERFQTFAEAIPPLIENWRQEYREDVREAADAVRRAIRNNALAEKVWRC